MVMVTGVLILRVKFLSFAVPATTRILKFDVAAVVGVPLMTPCDAESVNPAGSEPESTLHVRCPTPPTAISVTE